MVVSRKGWANASIICLIMRRWLIVVGAVWQCQLDLLQAVFMRIEALFHIVDFSPLADDYLV